MAENYPQRKRLYHDTPSWVARGSVFFITVNCLKRGENALCHPDIAERIFESLEFRIRAGEWYPTLFLLIPDHCHGLIAFSAQVRMKSILKNWKRYLARNLGIQWQEDFFDHRIRSVTELNLKANYIRQNPVRAGLVKAAEDWPYVWTNVDG
ncbi:MAG: transposase [Opitutales bacterium]|nr:transposase [Opitutales bacterium]